MASTTLVFTDKNRYRTAYIQPMFNSDGSVDLHINTTNGSVYVNGTKIG